MPKSFQNHAKHIPQSFQDHPRIRRAFGPSACRDPLWRVFRSKGPTFNWSWGPLQPGNFPSSNSRSHLGDPLALQGLIFDWFLDHKFRIDFWIDFCIDVWTILHKLWDHVGSFYHHFYTTFSNNDFAQMLFDFLSIFGTPEPSGSSCRLGAVHIWGKSSFRQNL